MSEKLLQDIENYEKAKLPLSLKEKNNMSTGEIPRAKKKQENYLSAPENEKMTGKKVSFFKSNSLSNIFFSLHCNRPHYEWRQHTPNTFTSMQLMTLSHTTFSEITWGDNLEQNTIGSVKHWVNTLKQ